MGPDLHVRKAHTLQAEAGSTNHLTKGTSGANLYPWARHACFLEHLIQCVYIHIPTGSQLRHIKAVSENIWNNEMHHCCYRKINWKDVQCLAEWGWLRSLMLLAADQEIKHRAVHHNHGRWRKMSHRQSSGYQKPSLLSQQPLASSAYRKKPACFNEQSNSLEILWNRILSYTVCCQMIRRGLGSVFSGTQMENDVMDTVCQNNNPHLNLHIRDILHLKCQTCKWRPAEGDAGNINCSEFQSINVGRK